MSERPQRLSGVFAPVVTPFGADLKPDPDRFLQHCRWLLSQECGLAVFGTNSEGNSLSVAERRMMLDHLVENSVPGARMMPGTGCSALTDTVELTRHAVESGAAGVLMLPPFYYKGVSDDALFRSFSEVVQRVGDPRLRVYLYHIPSVAQVPITLPLIERLVKAYPDTVVGLKDSSADWTNTKAVLDAVPDFQVFVGSESFLLRNLQAGGAGCISAMANVNPAAINRLFLNWRTAEAERLQAELDATRAAFGTSLLIVALKATIAAFRRDPGWSNVRPPLLEPAPAEAEALAARLRHIGFGMPGLDPLLHDH